MFYRAYGLTLASALPLPELAAAVAPDATGAPDLAIDLATDCLDGSAWTPLPPPDGEGPWLAVAYRAGAHRLRFEGGGTFVVSDGGRRVTVQIGTSDRPDTLRHLLIDQVIPLALGHMGHVVLHASGVVLKDAESAVAFIGPAGAGKSTLTASLANSGCLLLADDALVVTGAGSELLATPAYPGYGCGLTWPSRLAPAVPTSRSCRA